MKTFKKFGYGMLILIFCACNNFVNIDPPETELVRKTVFTDGATAEAALMDVYGQMRDNSLFDGSIRGMSSLFGHYADELILYSTNQQSVEEFFNHTVLPGESQITTIWNDCYNLIYSINAILEGLTTSTSISQDVKDQLEGEALFTRAFVHFYLVNLFGDIPYITSADYRENMNVFRMETDEVYVKMIEDLKHAKILLEELYVTRQRIRPNLWTASALLSRIYLYQEQWQQAETESTGIINKSLYGLNALEDVFLKNSMEAIWQFIPQTLVENTNEARTFIFTSGPPPTTALSNTLINSFELEDQRLENWVGRISSDSNTWYYAHKYKINTTTHISQEYPTIFRLAEQYLIRAEARARQGNNLIEAIADVDAIRERAGLTLIKDTNPGINATDLLDVIMHERQLEFFTEYGHRWLDLKRTGKAKEALQGRKAGWRDTDILLPLPENELLTNPNLQPQNLGYN